MAILICYCTSSLSLLDTREWDIDSPRIAPELIIEHLDFKNFLGGMPPDPPIGGPVHNASMLSPNVPPNFNLPSYASGIEMNYRIH